MIYRIYWFLVGILAGILLSMNADAQVKAAIIDDGFNISAMPYTKLCKDGHYDFIQKKPGIFPPQTMHGTFVTLSATQMISRSKNYCFVIYKVFDGTATDQNIAKAIDMAVKNKYKAINISIESTGWGAKVVKQALARAYSHRVHVFIAAGNSQLDLNKECRSFPSCYNPKANKYKHIVGATDIYNNRAFYSNYGSLVTEWFPGDYRRLWGTSFASPRAMGYYLETEK